jgi:hypothetical protein
LKDLISITVRLTEKDPLKFRSRENVEKLELCAQAIEIGAAISFAISELVGVEHKTFANEERMEISFVYSAPDQQSMGEFLKKFGAERERLVLNIQESKLELAKEGIEIETKITTIETLELPA